MASEDEEHFCDHGEPLLQRNGSLKLLKPETRFGKVTCKREQTDLETIAVSHVVCTSIVGGV